MRLTAEFSLRPILVAVLFATASATSVAQNISTIAGTGARGTPTDNVVGTSSTVDGTNGIALDRFGNLFVTDSNHHRVRKIGLDGKITTVAGTGTQGFAGDGAAATAAQLNYPTTIAINAAGELFIADYGNHRVRKIAADGKISTVAGSGTEGFAGDGSAATAAQLNNPVGVAIAPNGDLLIADSQNHRIRRVNSSGIISTVAGTGTLGFAGDGAAATSAQFSYPGAMSFAADGSLLVADYGNNRVRKIDTSGNVSTFAGSAGVGFSGDAAAATSAQLNGPFGVSLGTNGSVLIADQINGRIRKVAADGVISTVAGGGSSFTLGDGAAATSAFLLSPSGVAANAAGDVFISDRGNLRVRKVASPLRELVEYRLTSADAYFYTSKDAEKFLLDGISAWQRTGATILVNAASVTGSKALVRYYFDAVAQNPTRGTHFYTLRDDEIASLNALNPNNSQTPRLPYNEGTEAFAFAVTNGACTSAQTPVYRAFRNATVAPNNPTHRLTTNVAAYNALVAAGWTAEGIAFCAPVAP